MPSFSADVSAVYAIAADLEAVAGSVPAAARQVVAKSALDVEAGGKRRAPVDTGNLRGSITTELRGNGQLFSAEIGPTANYGGHVEFGTYKMGPQPYMGPAGDEAEPAFVAAMEQIGGMIL